MLARMPYRVCFSRTLNEYDDDDDDDGLKMLNTLTTVGILARQRSRNIGMLMQFLYWTIEFIHAYYILDQHYWRASNIGTTLDLSWHGGFGNAGMPRWYHITNIGVTTLSMLALIRILRWPNLSCKLGWVCMLYNRIIAYHRTTEQCCSVT